MIVARRASVGAWWWRSHLHEETAIPPIVYAANNWAAPVGCGTMFLVGP